MKKMVTGITQIALWLLFFSTASSQVISESFQQESPTVVERAYADAGGNVHVVLRDGRDDKISKEKDQVGGRSIRIAVDKKTVGWTVLYENCCTSYPIPLLLVIYRDGKVQQRLDTGGLMIYDWRFWSGEKQVAFCTGTVHGDSGGHCELHDVKSGRALAVIDGHLGEESPLWARGLQN